jgi:hypothetical protein
MIFRFLIKQYLSGHQAEDKILEWQGNGIKSDPKKRLYAVPCPRIFCELNFRKRLIGKKYVPRDIGLPCIGKRLNSFPNTKGLFLKRNKIGEYSKSGC